MSKPREFWILPDGHWARLCEKDDFAETKETVHVIEYSHAAKLEAALEIAKQYIHRMCNCENLADPSDRSRYANYEKHSGHCFACQHRSAIDEALGSESGEK